MEIGFRLKYNGITVSSRDLACTECADGLHYSLEDGVEITVKKQEYSAFQKKYSL